MNMQTQNEIDDLIDAANSSVGDLEEATMLQQSRITKLETLLELLYGRRWMNLTVQKAKVLGERIQNELLND